MQIKPAILHVYGLLRILFKYTHHVCMLSCKITCVFRILTQTTANRVNPFKIVQSILKVLHFVAIDYQRKDNLKFICRTHYIPLKVTSSIHTDHYHKCRCYTISAFVFLRLHLKSQLFCQPQFREQS